MAYLKINNVDFSDCVAMLKVGKQQKFKSMETAAGNLLVKPITSKYILDVGFIPLTVDEMKRLQTHIGKLTVSISFLDPATDSLKTVSCMLTNSLVEYYTIQSDGTILYKPFSLQFQQL